MSCILHTDTKTKDIFIMTRESVAIYYAKIGSYVSQGYKPKHFNFQSGCIIWVVKHLKED